MLRKDQLVRAFERNVRVVEAQAEGLDHGDSLLQTEFRINCFNWTVGHLISSRDDLLEALGAQPLFGDELDRYRRESEPILEDGPGVLPFDRLLAMLRESQGRIGEVLANASEEALVAEVTVGERTTTPASRAFFHFFHDTYHTGQTELLRQVAGVGDSVI